MDGRECTMTRVQKFVKLQRRKNLNYVAKKKPMSPRSAKAKGRKLQTWVVDKILALFPSLSSLDVKSTPMGVNGVDVQLSSLAQKFFPYDIECKNCGSTILSTNEKCMYCGAPINNKSNDEESFNGDASQKTIEIDAEEIK